MNFDFNFDLSSIDKDILLIAAAAACLLILVLLILVIVLMVKSAHQKRDIANLTERYEAFMQGQNGASLEARLTKLARDSRKLDLNMKNLDKEMEALTHRMSFAFRKISIVKYNSSADMGGIMSFVLVLLDEKNDGFILNVIHAREGSYPYIKRVDGGEPEMDLSREEARALETAMIQS